MVLRWIHKGWKAFWTVILSLLLIVVVVGGGALGLLQLDATKDVIAEKIENDFRKNYHGRLSIGQLDGFLPFNAELHEVMLTSTPDSVTTDTLARIGEVRIGIDLWAVLQNKLSIDAFSLDQPTIRLLANGQGGYTLGHALSKKKDQQPQSVSADEVTSSWIRNIEIIAPQVRISNGELYIEEFYESSESLRLPEPFRITDINARMFVELTDQQRFLDIESLTADARGLRAGNVAISGQVYNDSQYLEFNSFNFSAGRSSIRLNGEIEGVDVYQGDLQGQLSGARYDIRVGSDRLQLSEFTDLLTQLPDIEEPLDFSVQTSGTTDNLELNTFRLGVGESYFSIDGEVQHLFERPQLAYNFFIDTLAVRNQDVEIFTGPLSPKQYRALENLRLNGRAEGTADSLRVDVSGSSSLGSFELNGEGQLNAPYGYQGALTGRGVDIGPLVESGIDTTSLNFRADINGQNTSLTSGRMQFVGLARNSFVNHIRIDSLRFSTTLQQGRLNTDYYYRNGRQVVSGEATADFNRDDPPITLRGDTRSFNIPSFFANAPVDSTSLNTSYEIDMQGLEPDRMMGRARFEVEPSVIDGDSVQSHQIEVALDSPDLASRTLQVNSSLFDLRVTGDLQPSNISNQVTYWSNYFKERLAEEVRLDSSAFIPDRRAPVVSPMQLEGRLEAKNLMLVQRYWPSFPSLITNSTATFNVQADSSDLQFSSTIQSDTLRINDIQVRDAGSRLGGQFRHGEKLKDYGRLDFSTDVARLESRVLEMDSVEVDLNYAQDSLHYTQRVQRFSEDARFNMRMHTKLSESNLNITIDDFFLGNQQYAWQNASTPRITYNRDKEVIFESFRFQNQNEFFALRGRLSPDPSDSLEYVIRDINLGRISDLLKNDLTFDGRLNGTFQTRSLRQTPSIQGDLTVTQLRLQDRLVGDVFFSSAFNEARERFDTRLKILTDTTKYRGYIAANDDIGQNIVLDGYFRPADMRSAQDTAFHFDARFNEIDMWVLQLIIPNVLNQVEGQASGTGFITGNLNEVNYSADFDVNNVYARPAFLNTNYYLDGNVTFSKQRGVVLNDLSIRDNRGGTGSIGGTVDPNNFGPSTDLDLRMTLNDLQFLNNTFDPDVPFYGSLAGTGTVRLVGDSRDMNLRSSSDIRVSQNSTLSIPLIAQTELNSNTNFIRFVESFEGYRDGQPGLTMQEIQNMELGALEMEQQSEDLSFNERFNIDLQFDAPDPINVRLIFDPVTGEKLLAEGTGRLRITMTEGDVQMFGNYAVNGGSYQFVSGEIFARELDIRPGGSIVWEGPADNARLDIEAVYHARPSIESLEGTGGAGDNSGAPRRVPVDLIVEISGTLSNVQNDYYFEVPSSFDLTSTSPLQFRLNQINSDEQQKLLQATSILLTGNFLATGQGVNSQTSQLRSNLSKGSTFINPILSNQLISPLLSNQVNSLLNSDVSEFDIDFQLNQYNQIDLGIALRLYNDKLILRREGYLTGGRSDNTFGERIGDLNATYRINQNLSLTAFHRQDQVFGTMASSQSGDLTQPVDGIGVEAQVQFNTWQQLGHKVHNFFRRLVGMEEIDFDRRAQNSEAGGEQQSTDTTDEPTTNTTNDTN